MVVRGDRRRNAQLSRLRELVPVDNAIVGIDLADEKQAIVLTNHDSQVLARRRVKAKAWRLGPVLDWARNEARQLGFADVTVGCEPTGHRWRVLDQLAAQRDMTLVCVQPLLTGRARESEDYTRDKTDDKDAVLIARLVAQLRCYAPERADEVWARLRHLGARRERLITEATACVQQLRDLLECAWPAVLNASVRQFDSVIWCAALAVVLGRCDGRPERLTRLGLARFEAAVRRELPRWGGKRSLRRIVVAVFAALSDPAGVSTQRRGAWSAPAGCSRIGAQSRLGARRWKLGCWRSSTSLSSPSWQAASPGSVRSGWRRFWLRPAIPPVSAAPVRWSSTPGSARGRTTAAPALADHGSLGVAGLGCGWPPGVQYGALNATIR